ncbi:MAG TPA: FAD-dependent oxidoreductase [Phycisphaerales bacterium]|nr:FAD-dependent oxidoreductase [Phycisphaerales bacterium]
MPAAGDIAVIGSGVAGLTAAIELATRLQQRGSARKADHPIITIYADRASAPAASFIAPALFTPYPGPDEERFRRWTERSFAALAGIAAEEPSSGVRMAELREYFYKPPVRRPWLDALLSTRPLRPIPPPLVEATASIRPHIDMLRYMPWLESRAAALGVRFERRVFGTLDEAFALGHRTVVNCAGVGAGRLAADPLVKPMHGQVLHLRNDIGLTYSLHDDAGSPGGQVAYIFVFEGRLVLGGTFDAGRDDHTTDRPALDAVLERCRNLLRMDGFPRWAELGRGRTETGGAGLTSGELRSLAGVRPTRGPGGVGRAGAYEHTRVERELLNDRGGTVIHCYGHGRSGATLSWGSAAEAADLLLEQEP